MADNQPNTVVVERSGNGTGLMIGLALVILLAIAGYFVLNQTNNDNLRTDAVTSAAKDVGDSAEQAGGAVEKAVDPNK